MEAGWRNKGGASGHAQEPVKSESGCGPSKGPVRSPSHPGALEAGQPAYPQAWGWPGLLGPELRTATAQGQHPRAACASGRFWACLELGR